MQIVIDIPEEIIRYMQSRFMYQDKDDTHLSTFEKAGIAIKNGTPLPKGHGRLIDADMLQKMSDEKEEKYGISCVNLNDVSTIIEADKEK